MGFEGAAFGDDGGKERCCTASKGDEFASDSSPFQFYFCVREPIQRGGMAPERNSPEERGTHRDFARKESGN